ncbi:PREDICTED: high mobility group B protein 7-like [Ipomoea nil]|uniref:high mobility group B protein 7-like n=1 Tax=Ipomoea nil TaxID=35883 RepID=UPI000901865A|nr:PREDICTED: high mobility group B protein 7-like [Ipomoea nil]
MAGGGASGKSSNAPRVRKRVEVDSNESSQINASLKRAKDGSAFARCDECNKDVPVALISFHNCSLDAKIKMNLEAQIIEKPAEPKKKPTEKKKARSTEPKAKKEKKAKDPNAPKRPPTAFFVFMEEFRKTFKEENPDIKSVATVAKEGGEKWKSLTDEEKKLYIDRAAERKAEYEKALESNNATENEDDGDESEKEVKEEVQEVNELDDE